MKRKRPNIIDEDDIKSGNIPFIKNVNRYGDSDYDDEVDKLEQVDNYEAQIAREKKSLHDSQAGEEHFPENPDDEREGLIGANDNANLK